MRRKRLAVGAALAAISGLLCCGFLMLSMSSITRDAFATPLERALDEYPFGGSSEWRQDVSAWSKDPNSGFYVQDLVKTIKDRYGGVAAFNTDGWATPYYVAPADTPSTTVRFSNCHDFDAVPRGLFGDGGQFERVPIPSDAQPASQSDSTMAIYSPSRDALWEFWSMKLEGEQWSACWGGRIDRVSKSPGYFEGGFGASGSALSYAGGMVRIAEVEQGVIPHAIAVAIPNTAAKIVVHPAQRTDGWDVTPWAVPEGTRLRLKSDVRIHRLHLSPIARLVATAAKKYGFIVTDTSGAVAISGQGLKMGKGDAWAPLLGQHKGYNVLENFPWDDLEVVQPARGSN